MAIVPDLSAVLSDLNIWLVLALFGIPFIAALLFIPWVVVRIPADYFHARRRHREPWNDLPQPLRLGLIVLKNLLGVVLMLLGIAMLVLPGQGVMTMLVGLVLIDFPGKFRLERWLVTRGPILRSINWLRRRRGKPELEL